MISLLLIYLLFIFFLALKENTSNDEKIFLNISSGMESLRIILVLVFFSLINTCDFIFSLPTIFEDADMSKI